MRCQYYNNYLLTYVFILLTFFSQDTLRKLSRSWPNLDKPQVFCLSTSKAWHTKLAGYVSEDFSRLVDGIQRLVPVGLQRKIQLSYK